MRRLLSFSILFAFLVLSFLAGTWYSNNRRSKKLAIVQSERRVLYYVDPMHPAYKSDKPGIAPDCGMQLEPVFAETDLARMDESSAKLPPGIIQVSPQKQQLIGVQTGLVVKTSGSRTLRTVGRVTLDERRVFRISALVDGLVRNSGAVVTGSTVRENEVLGTFYNRDLISAQQAYLYALDATDRLKGSGNSDQTKLAQSQLQAAQENLEFLGMSEGQLQEIVRTRQVARHIELRSPVAGLVVARNILPGLRFERNAELYRIVELSRVWILADIFENEAEYFHPGAEARVSLPQQQKVFHATVSQAVPQFDPATRTIKLRLEAENPGFVLRPDMFVDVEVSSRQPPAVTVLGDAVIDSGRNKTVFVDHGNGFFEPRIIETGWRNGDRVEVLHGLAPGERIAISGTFLLDSESRLQSAARRASSTAEDPVCGMLVDEAAAKVNARFREHEGKMYYFCSDQCVRAFEKNPNETRKSLAARHQSKDGKSR